MMMSIEQGWVHASQNLEKSDHSDDDDDEEEEDSDDDQREDGAGAGEDGDDDQTRWRLVKPWDNLITVQ